MILSKRYTVLDIETSGLEIDCTINFIGIHTFDNPEDEGNYYLYDMKTESTECIEHLKKLKGFIGHNAKFDSKIIKYNLGIDLKIQHDTMYLCYLCSSVHDMIHKRGKWLGLKQAAMRELKVKSWDIDLETKKSGNIDVKKYLKHDLYYTRRLFEHFKERIDDKDKLTYSLMIKAANVYRDIECHGLPLDLDQLNKTMSDYNLKAIEINAKLKKMADINYNSPKQLVSYLFDELGLPVVERSKTGQPSTGVEALTELKGKHPVIELILEKRNIDKALTFLKDWKERQKDGRLYGNFNLHTTVTGRTSSNGPNIQQVPRNKDLKSLFRSKPGWKFIQIDYSQMELRTAAAVAGVSAMINSYKNGEDLHTNMAATIAGVKKEDVTKQQRTSAKAANFGYLYGMQAKTFVKYAKVSYGVEMPLNEAKQIRDKFFETNYELLPYYKKVEQELVTNGYLTNVFGRRYKVGFNHLYTPGDRIEYVRKGINFTVQSTASDWAIMALIEIHHNYKDNPDIKIIGTVHDSILFEIRDNDKLKDYLKHIKHIMQEPSLRHIYFKHGGRLEDFPLPIVADIEIGPWGKGEEITL